jgi:hypothetical protein
MSPVTGVVADAVSFARFTSFPPDATALFVTDGTAAACGVTVKVNGAVPAEAIDVVRVAVTTFAVAVIVHPAPTADTYVSPAGSESRTVTVPAVAAFPLLPTVMVYAAFTP